METKHIIEVDESQRRLIIGTLNEKRNAMVEQGRDTGQRVFWMPQTG